MQVEERQAEAEGVNLHHDINQSAQHTLNEGLTCLARSIISELLSALLVSDKIDPNQKEPTHQKLG